MYFILECDKSYFVKNLSDSYKKLSETDIVKMQDLFYCVFFFPADSRHSYGYQPLLAHLMFFFTYEEDFIRRFLIRK